VGSLSATRSMLSFRLDSQPATLSRLVICRALLEGLVFFSGERKWGWWGFFDISLKCSERHITEVKECHLTQFEVAKGFSTYSFGGFDLNAPELNRCRKVYP
jgi:hypothetical protein